MGRDCVKCKTVVCGGASATDIVSNGKHMLLPRRLGVSDGTRPSGLSQRGLNSKGSDNPAAATTVRPALCNPSTAHTNKQLDVRMERSTLVDDKKKILKVCGNQSQQYV